MSAIADDIIKTRSIMKRLKTKYSHLFFLAENSKDLHDNASYRDRMYVIKNQLDHHRRVLQRLMRA